MKNKILIAAFAAAVCASSSFGEGIFLGIEGDYSFKSSITTKWSDEDDSGTNDNKGQAALGFKGGYDFGIARAYGEYLYDFKASKTGTDEDIIFKHEWNKHSLLVGVDFTPEITNGFKLVAGAYTGVSFLKYKIYSYDESDGSSDSLSKTLPGWVIGARLGGLYSFDEHNEIEFGYKADYTRYKASKLGKDIDKAYETNHGLYLGYNFKF